MVISAGKQSEQTIIIVTSKMVPPTILWGECFFFYREMGVELLSMYLVR